MTAVKSIGKCIYCEEISDSTGISKHLSGHLKKLEKELPSSNKVFHIKVSAGEMFLHILLNDSCKFAELDHFLRSIWLECCGHMSSFQVKGKDYDFGWDDDEDFGEKKTDKVSKAFKKGVKLEYQYDFGSTTQLEILVVNEYKLALKEDVFLLSRNEPLPILCHLCNEKTAIVICSVCVYQGECMFCESCSKKHKKSCEDFADYSRMPVVNSPRMGICAYEGGSIDLERDGIWKGGK